MNYNELKKETMLYLKNFPKQNQRSLVEFLRILIRLQKKNPSEVKEQIIKETLDMIRNNEIYGLEEKNWEHIEDLLDK